jgi:RHS repeat-associated protein
MDWQVTRTDDNKQRGYNFAYDNLSRLTNANYLVSGASNTNFTTAYAYDKQGNVTHLTRHGNTNTAAYGLVDNVALTYQGNQLKSAEDAVQDASVVLSASADFKDKVHNAIEYTYDANGNQTMDGNSGITSIEYNLLNLPKKITFAETGVSNEYVYSATGTKLAVVHKSASGMPNTTRYVGNIIYEGNDLMIQVDGGYVKNGQYYFYLQDHLGSARVVANASGTVIQRNHYYPYGALFAESYQPDKQPFKYIGKELDTKNGLNWTDLGARFYTGLRLPTMDPLAEKYYSWSPYSYGMANPGKYVDPDGRDIRIWYRNSNGKQTSFVFNGNNAASAPNNTFVKSVITAYNYNVKNGGGRSLQTIVTSEDMAVSITQSDLDNTFSSGLKGFIRFNPSAGMRYADGHTISPATGLEHEATHALKYKTGQSNKNYDSKYGTKEERSIIKGAELETAKANGEIPKSHRGRQSHSEGEWIVTKSVMSNEELNVKQSEGLRKRIREFKQGGITE